jgi:hypothetical protein
MIKFQKVKTPDSGGAEYDAFVTMFRQGTNGQAESVPIRVARVYVIDGRVEGVFFERGFSWDQESGKRSMIYSAQYPREPSRNSFSDAADQKRHLELISGALLVRLKSDKSIPTFYVEE